MIDGTKARQVYGTEAKRAARREGFPHWMSVDSWLIYDDEEQA